MMICYSKIIKRLIYLVILKATAWYVVKLNRVIELQDIARETLISIKNIIRKERVKGWMGNPKVLLNIVREPGFTDTSKDVCTYYTLQGREDNCGNKIIDKSLR